MIVIAVVGCSTNPEVDDRKAPPRLCVAAVFIGEDGQTEYRLDRMLSGGPMRLDSPPMHGSASSLTGLADAIARLDGPTVVYALGPDYYYPSSYYSTGVTARCLTVLERAKLRWLLDRRGCQARVIR